MSDKTPIILPCETWAREFDAKLLLACCLAERGFPVHIGCKNTINLNITSFPRGLYVAKDFRVSSDTMFGILKNLGHTIMAWDEEATVPFGDEEYHAARISPPSFEKVSAFFAWGTANKHSIETAPCGISAPVHLTGNPRGDLMRPELHSYFAKEAEELRDKYGDIILINSNFGKVNHFLELERVSPGELDPGLRGRPISPQTVKRSKHKAELFQHFLKLIPLLARSFPEKTIVVRPHPSEQYGPWQDAGAGFDNVAVIYKGHVHPWLHACQTIIHSSCTTGVEAYLLNRPVLGYQPVTTDASVEELPNKLSHNIFSSDELIETVSAYCSGQLKPSKRAELDELIDPIIGAMDGPLASDRIADKIEESLRAGVLDDQSGWNDKLVGNAKALIRAMKKQIDYRNPNHKSSLEYDRHRFPELSLSLVEDRLKRFREILGRFDNVQTTVCGSSNRVFKVSGGSSA